MKPERSRRLFRIALIALLFSSAPALVWTASANPAVSDQSERVTVTGKVRDAQGVGMPGVRVMEKNTQNGTLTDAKGEFRITVKKSSTLVLSYIGYKTTEVKSTTTAMNIVLHEDSEMLEEVVVVGYGTQKKENLTGAVSSVDVAKTLKSRPIADVGKALQGTTPGLTITSISGSVGGEPTIKLRGSAGSLNALSGTRPLILVDNVEIPSLSLINPDDIESISVLKDAASAAIYGTRAAWGVVLITTKKGNYEQKPRVSFSSNFGWSTPTMMPKLASAYDNAMAGIENARRHDNSDSYNVIGYSVNPEAAQKMKEWKEKYGGMSEAELGEIQEGRDFEYIGGKWYFYREFDPVNMFMNKWSPSTKHDVSVSGGTAKTSYNISLGYNSNHGALKVNTDVFRRYNFNANVNSRINDLISVRAGMMYSSNNYEEPYKFTSGVYDMWYYLLRWPRFYPYGTYKGKPFRSAITEIAGGRRQYNQQHYTRLNIGTTLTPLKGLDINLEYTYGLWNNFRKKNGGEVWGYDFFNTSNPFKYSSLYSEWHNRTNSTSRYSGTHTGKAFATYNWSLNDNHRFKFMLGTDIEQKTRFAHSSDRKNLINPDYPEISLAIGDQFVDDEAYRNNFASAGVFGRINYSLMDRYLFEFNARYDGSSRFPENHRWAFFPSGSVGWRVSEEGFFTSLKPTFSDLKLRASYGTVGNQDVSPTAFLSVMEVKESDWVVNEKNQPYIKTPSTLSPNLTWERVSTIDFGVDARFFHNELGVSFDWYRRTTSGMHSPGETLPVTFGQANPMINYGEMRGQGFEIGVDYNHRFSSDFGVFAKATFSKAKEVITKYPSASKALGSYYEGMVLGEIWGFETDRFFTTEDCKKVVDSNTNKEYYVIDPQKVPDQSLFETDKFSFGPGDVKYKDLDGDGKITYGKGTADDHGDLRIIGNTNPNYEYSFTLGADFKGFDISMYFQGVGKREIWPIGSIGTPGFGKFEAFFEHQMDYWTPERPDAFYPRISDNSWVSNGQNFRKQTKYLQDMSYLRFKNLTVGYTLPREWTQKAYIDNLRVFFSGENIFEFYKGHIPIDPEVSTYKAGASSDGYSVGRTTPFMRTLSVGAQLTF